MHVCRTAARIGALQTSSPRARLMLAVSGSARVHVVQTAEHDARQDRAVDGSESPPRLRCITIERLVASFRVVVLDKLLQHAT